MLKLKGDYLEGGGQILRTSLSLSAVTGKEFTIENIRKNRPKPGLAIQHLQALRTIAQITSTETKAKKGDTYIEFFPQSLTNGGKMEVEIPTAGSSALLISTILPVACRLKKYLVINISGGGTWNKWAPSVVYLQKVLLPILEKIGLKAEIKISKNGFVPWGEAEVEVKIFPWNPVKKLVLQDCNIEKINVYSLASKSLRGKNVAERQMDSAKKELNELKIPLEEKTEYVEGDYYGSGMLVYSSPSIIGSDIVGEKGKKAEIVGRQAASAFAESFREKAAVDSFAADQLMIYLALAGGKVKTSRISNHARTNAYVIEKFLPVKFCFNEEEKIIECQEL